MKSFADLSRLVDVLAEKDTSAGEYIVTSDGQGFATHDAAEGEIVQVETGGIFTLDVMTDADLDAGAPVFFVDGIFTASGETLVGHTYDPAESDAGVAHVTVKLGA